MTSAACCSPKSSIITAALSVPDILLNSACNGEISGFSSTAALPFLAFCFLSFDVSLAIISSPILP